MQELWLMDKETDSPKLQRVCRLWIAFSQTTEVCSDEA